MLGCLRKLLRSQPMSAGALYAAATGSRAPRPPSCARLTRRLLLNFMLWTAGGHAIARDIVTTMAQTAELTREVTGFLEQTLYRWDRLCTEAPASRELARELLAELQRKPSAGPRSWGHITK